MVKKGLLFFSCLLGSLIVLFLSVFIPKKRKKIIFGTTPILNNKYWANALNSAGIPAETLMSTFYASINRREDFNYYFEDFFPIKGKYFFSFLARLMAFLYTIRNARVVVMPFHGFIFSDYCWKLEYLIFKLSNIKTIIMPYGSDSYMYSRIKSSHLQHALLISYPDAAKHELSITKKVYFWSNKADCVIPGFMGIDGFPRWDILMFQFVQINTDEWPTKKNYSSADGVNAPVRIVHSPNHRGFKGTEFLIKTIEDIKREGLKVELVLLEGIQNNLVKEELSKADILAEQFVATAYALSGIEGLASGLPVLSNLDDERYTDLFRRYSFLDECPIVSTTPESLKNNLVHLIKNPALRKQIGIASREYAEKYHSQEMSCFMFNSILDKFDGKKVDLINLFHPLKGTYKYKSKIQNPLIKNKIAH